MDNYKKLTLVILLLAFNASWSYSVTIFDVNFNNDIVGQYPETGYYRTDAPSNINAQGGSILVIEGKGNLLDKPVEMHDFIYEEQCLLSLLVSEPITTGVVRLEWDSMLGSELLDDGWGPMVQVYGMVAPLCLLYYEVNGKLTNTFNTLPISYVPLISNHFRLIINLVNYTSTLYIDDSEVHKDIPFSAYYDSQATEFVRLLFYTAVQNEWQQSFIIDNIKGAWTDTADLSNACWSDLKLEIR